MKLSTNIAVMNLSKMLKQLIFTFVFSFLTFGFSWGQSLEWAKSIGGTSLDVGTSIALDASGNAYTTGKFQGTVDFDPGADTFNLTSAGSEDIFISKLDPSGNFLWAKRMGSINNDVGHSVALDASGNAYTTGRFQGTVDFDPGAGTFNITSAGYDDIFISKLDSSGNFLWAKRMGSTSEEFGQSIALDASGNVYTTGKFQGTVDFDPGVDTFNLTSAGDWDIFISKLDPLGNFLWAKRMGSSWGDYVNSIALDASGNAYTTGMFQGTVDFDPGAGTFNLTSAGDYDIFISKLDPSGNFLWAKRMGSIYTDGGNSITLDASGNAYTTGNFQGTVDFDQGVGTFNITSLGGNDIFISKLDPSGNFLWAKAMAGTSYENGISIALDSSGNAYITGNFQSTVDFDPGVGTFNLASVGLYDIFILKLKQQGISGYIFNDLNQNCQKDSLEIGIQNRFVTINPGNIIAQTNESGTWVIDSLPVGTYTATFDTSGNWSPTCPVTQTFSVTNPNEITYVPDFGLVSTQPCASPDVSVNMPRMRPCFSNQKVYVNACNQYVATGVLNTAYADVELDSLIIPQSASLTFTSLGNNTYRFQLGNLNPGQCKSFTINCQVSCDVMLGQTLCLEANLYPADSCVFDTIPNPYPGDFTPCTLPWDKSSLSVKGWCKNDSIYFSVYNSGDDMDCYSPVRVYIDGVYTILDSVQLTAETCFFYTFAGDGRTWRLEADQHPLHPGNSHPNATVEACGNLSNWTPDLVNILPPNDADPIVDIYCGLVTGSYDPNDKTGYPTGVTSSNYIYPNQQLQYTIRFQNTGTDTAFTVVVRDTLDMDLDIFSVVQGVASHTYNFQMYGPRVLEWTFYNIQLPDSNHNEAASHGFCTFTVNQDPNLPDGTEIRNSADIYFDYNEPVITNQTLHTVYEFRLPLSYSDTVYVNDTVCYSYLYNGLTYNNTGTYYQTNNDTLTIINLTIKDSTVLNLSIISCADYELNGIVYDSTGIYKQILVNSLGCDSIINLDLTILPKYYIDTNIAICQGDSLIFGTQTLKTAGIFSEMFNSVYGCDSLVNLELFVNVPTSSTTNITACDSFTWTDGNTYTASGTYSQTLTSSVGCDSVATLELILGVSTSSTTNVTTCDSYTWTNGNTYTTSGTYTQTLTNSAGCDSVATLDLILGVSTSSTTIVTTCDAFTWTDGNTYTTSGTYTQTLVNSVGCDSVATLELIFDNVFIPDVYFKIALINNSSINTNGDDEIQCDEASTFSGIIEVNNYEIADLSGIEAFTAITSLRCHHNYLTNLDVSSNKNLLSLNCAYNQLTSLNLSENTSITYLSCENNKLSSLDISVIPALEKLYCSDNQLTSLNVSTNTVLTDLNCSGNQLTSLNLSTNTELVNLECSLNQLTSLDFSTNINLVKLICSVNQLTNLDFSFNTKLSYLSCGGNQLTSLNLSTIPYIYFLVCGYNQLSTLNVKNGNNHYVTTFSTMNNPSLICINVDDAAWSTSHWANIDSWASFSDNCYLGENSVSNNQIEINVYPNPATDEVFIEISNIELRISNDEVFSIYGLEGKLVKKGKLNGSKTRISTKDLESGVYFIEVNLGNSKSSSKLVITK